MRQEIGHFDVVPRRIVGSARLASGVGHASDGTQIDRIWGSSAHEAVGCTGLCPGRWRLPAGEIIWPPSRSSR